MQRKLAILFALTALLVHSSSAGRLRPPSCSNRKIDIVFLVDTSASGSRRDALYIRWIKIFLRQLVTRFSIGNDKTRVGVVGFCDVPKTFSLLNEHVSDLQATMNAIDSLQYGNGLYSKTWSGLDWVRTRLLDASKGDRDEAPDVVVHFTDGGPTSGDSNENPTTLTAAAAEKLKKEALLITVGFGVSRQEAAPWSDVFIPVSHFNAPKITRAIEKVGKKICQNRLKPPPETKPTLPATRPPVPAPEPPAPEPPAPEPPAPEPPASASSCDSMKADIIFLVDTSAFVKRIYFERWMKLFLRVIVGKFKISRRKNRVGLVGFNNRARIFSHLNQHMSNRGTKFAINRVIYGGARNLKTWRGLDKVRQQMLKTRRGDRKGCRNIVVLLTDGPPSTNNRQENPVALSEAAAAKIKKVAMLVAVGFGVSKRRAAPWSDVFVSAPPLPVSTRATIKKTVEKVCSKICVNS